MGIKNIMQARKVLLIVSGEGKAEILDKVLYGPVTPQVRLPSCSFTTI